MHKTAFPSAAALIVLAACAPQAPTQEAEAPLQATCEASEFSYLQGEPIEVVDTLQTPLSIRVLGPDDFVTRDFRPNRLTITESPDGTVSRVFCG